ncbi:MAG TPA: hypothetical protein VJO99_16850 [Burkholderiaceae bacterium]|nr:hypothetical protein [Burkholderiaceae bacterium]
MNRPEELAEQLREALSFLSHDAREGHSSTLALLELHRARADSVATSELAQRIERNARRSLTRIDDFVAYARAGSQALQPEEIDLHELLLDAIAEAWQTGTERGLRLRIVAAPEAAPVQADGGLLRAALAQMLRHALDLARRGSDLVCTLREQPQAWSIEVDEAATDASPSAASTPDASTPRNAPPRIASGHGWALVALVAQRHAGSARAWEEPSKEIRLRIDLPRS